MTPLKLFYMSPLYLSVKDIELAEELTQADQDFLDSAERTKRYEEHN